MSDQKIEELLAKQEIYELACSYARGLDRLDRALLSSVFAANAFCQYGFYDGPYPAFVDYAMTALEGHEANHHMLGNTLIEVDGDEAFGEIYFHAYHKVKSTDGFDDLVIAGRYLDRYERHDGEWKIVYRSERNDWSRTQPTHDPYFDASPDGLRGARMDDAVYDKDARRRRA